MKKLITSLCLIVTLAIGSFGVGWSGDFQKGLDAAQRGDYTTALKEWTSLAEQGDAKAQYNLGVMYALGQGVIADKVYAHMWGNILNSNGHKDGKKIMDYLLKQGMTPSQVEKAQDLARECIKKNYKGC